METERGGEGYCRDFVSVSRGDEDKTWSWLLLAEPGAGDEVGGSGILGTGV